MPAHRFRPVRPGFAAIVAAFTLFYSCSDDPVAPDANSNDLVHVAPEAVGYSTEQLQDATQLAEQSGYPVVPVAHNAGEYWPRRGFLKYPGTIQVVIGPPIDTRGRSPEQIIAAAEAWIETTVGQISRGRETPQ